MKIERTSNIPWDAIQEAATNEALTIPEIARRFDVADATVRQRVRRNRLVLVSSLIPKVQRRIAEQMAEKAAASKAQEWLERGEAHREVVFKLGHESLKKMKPKAPKTFRDAEMADKMARRAAGLDVADNINQTLININEAMDAADEPQPVAATIVTQDAEITDDSSNTSKQLTESTPEPIQVPADPTPSPIQGAVVEL